VHSSKTRICRPNSVSLLTLLTAVGACFTATGVYAQQGDAEAGQAKATVCVACHGTDGNSLAPIWPSLAGQHPAYTIRQLQAYKSGQRTEPQMATFAAPLSDQDMADIAAFFAEQTPAVRGADPALAAAGERIYRGGIPERDIAACIACHGPRGKGNPLAGYPSVSHQHADYLSATLHRYQTGERRSDAALNQMMRNVAELLLDDEIEALASYMQGLN
jgi:cytochrome c553